jgi:FKBP-type peptidyl-prolyl cis-trans isomerase (trigger factor)
MKKVDFEVPQTLVERHSMMMLEEHFNRLPKNDAKVMEEVKKNLPKLTEEARKEATRIVRFSYVASEIAKAENIECKQEEMGDKVIEFIIANAKN